MMLKHRTRSGWHFLDNVAEVNARLPVAHDEHPDTCRAFQSLVDLREWVHKTYGDRRDFTAEFWPEFADDPPGAYQAYTIRPIVATLRDGGHALLLAGTETYLLADNGDTIERL